MKLFVLLLPALLALSSASLRDIVKRSLHNQKVSLLNPELEDLPSSFLFGDNVNLEWLIWDGSLPNGAISIYNSYTKRTDYVCKYKCEAGFYNPNLGSYCRYPYGNREYYASEFEILANKDNFEFLEWKEGSYGSVPQHSVKTCEGTGIYVGKNKYGLGKVVPQFEAFFLPWEGDEYWYKKYQYPPETMQISGVTNNECQSIVKRVTISKTSEVETTWNIGRGTMLGITGSITAKIPLIGSGGIELSGEKTLQFNRGTTVVESISHSVSVELTVPPNHICRVRMEGRKIKADIPYTARLSRTYLNGETQWTSISGTYDGVNIGEVRAVVDRCEPVADAKPCP
uniref:Natterin-3-like n=1 Tax=Nothobranchius furzeri TaxID=105023 RepID=A0A8C6PXN2_NOTFU